MTPTGRPYFVMELVKGVPITEYCDSAQLTTRERLELFTAVCHAVQHAHHKGIIHRDLKPSNVLVTLHDERPVVKVIDFGIAKAVNQDLTERTVFTEFRGFIGTPEYMSPERAAMSGLDVDTRTDVYSLGVLLYELVSGTPPFDPARLRGAGLAEIQRIIREDEPPRPSTRLSRASREASKGASKGGSPATAGGPGTTAEAIARHRRTDARTLRRRLAGDPDWIVMKAMEKDRQRRYDTAAALAEDVQRSLDNLPIRARPPSAAYRFRKFARRNRAGLAAATGVLSALLLTLAALGWGLVQVREERDMTARRETTTRAQMLLTTMNSVRKYTSENVRGKLMKAPGDYRSGFVQEMVPGYSARVVFDHFRSIAGDDCRGFVYKEAAPNPTNRSNRADEFEAGLVERFRADPALKELDGVREMGGVKTYWIARPMPVSAQSCLDCHTTPETAPPEQVALYGRESGYGWKLGEIVAAQVVYVPVSEALRHDRRWAVGVLGVLAGLFVLGGVASVVALRKA